MANQTALPPKRSASRALLVAGRSMVFAVLWGMAQPALAQSAPATPAGTTRPAPPITQPPGATIMAEPVALFLATLDADGDAKVTREEMRAGVVRSFASIDSGNTGTIGYIGLADWAERYLGDRNALPSAYETDGDGDNRISLAELTAQIDKTFTRFDRDKDNMLVRSELLTLDSARTSSPFDRGGKRGRRQ